MAFKGDLEDKAHSKDSEAGLIYKAAEIKAHESRGKKQKETFADTGSAV